MTIPFDRIDAHGSTVAGDAGAIPLGEALHRAFRPAIGSDYARALDGLGASGGRLVHLVEDGTVRALAVWRMFETTYCGRRCEIDDLVTDEASRSRGHGATLLRWIEDRARAEGCDTLTLNSATHRTGAHRFYLRERLDIVAFHFAKAL